MNQAELSRRLTPVDGEIALGPGTTFDPPLLNDILNQFNGGQPLVVKNAQVEEEIYFTLITGTADFLNTAALHVYAILTVTPDGTEDASICLSLPTGAAHPWQFSQSFGELPPFPNATIPNPVPTSNLLDALPLTDVALVLSTSVYSNGPSGAPITCGLNFVATVNATGFTGLFDPLLKAPCLMYGTITKPQEGVATPPLPESAQPWQNPGWPIPGIQLRAVLGIEPQLGKLRLTQPALRLYCPISRTWLKENSTYAPQMAVTGGLAIPSAGVTVDMTARLSPGRAELSGRFEGTALKDLSALADFTQVSDLATRFPAALQEALRKAGGLSLTSAGLTVTDQMAPEGVASAFALIDLPASVWPSIGKITADAISARFEITRPFDATQRKASATLNGRLTLAETPFNLTATAPDFAVQADLAPRTTLSLDRLLDQLLPGFPNPVPRGFAIDQLHLVVQWGGSFSLDAKLTSDARWSLSMGPVTFTLSRFGLHLEQPAGGGTTGALGARLQIGSDITLNVGLPLPGSLSLRGQLPELNLSWLLALFGDLGVPLPDGFDLGLDAACLLITEESGTLTFAVDAPAGEKGTLALVARRASGATGVVVGVQLSDPHFSAIPGLSALKPLDDIADLQQLLLVASTMQQDGFQFPTIPKCPVLAVKLPSQITGLTKGLNVYAQVKGIASPPLQAVAHFLGLRFDGSTEVTVQVSLPRPADSSRLYFNIGQLNTHGVTLSGEFGLALTGGRPSFFGQGNLAAEIEGQPVQFALTVTAEPNGVLLSGNMDGTIQLKPLPVQLSDLALVAGEDAVGVPSLGFAATLDVGNFDSSVAIFVNSANPAQSLFAGAISGFTLKDVAKLLVGQSNLGGLDQVLSQIGLKELPGFSIDAANAGALDARDLKSVAKLFEAYGAVKLLVVNTPGSVWHVTTADGHASRQADGIDAIAATLENASRLTATVGGTAATMTHWSLVRRGNTIEVARQPQLYCAPQTTRIGSDTFPQGLQVVGGIDYLVLKGNITAHMDPAALSVTVDSAVQPITFYKPSFFAITAADGNGGPKLSLSTQTASPHFNVSGQLRILGQDFGHVDAKVGADKITFDVGDRGGLEGLHGEFGGPDYLSVGARYTVGFDEWIGIVHVQIKVTGDVSIGVRNGSPYASLTGGFHFMGKSFNLGTITLDVNGNPLTRLAEIVWDRVWDLIKDLLPW